MILDGLFSLHKEDDSSADTDTKATLPPSSVFDKWKREDEAYTHQPVYLSTSPSPLLPATGAPPSFVQAKSKWESCTDGAGASTPQRDSVQLLHDLQLVSTHDITHRERESDGDPAVSDGRASVRFVRDLHLVSDQARGRELSSFDEAGLSRYGRRSRVLEPTMAELSRQSGLLTAKQLLRASERRVADQERLRSEVRAAVLEKQREGELEKAHQAHLELAAYADEKARASGLLASRQTAYTYSTEGGLQADVQAGGGATRENSSALGHRVTNGAAQHTSTHTHAAGVVRMSMSFDGMSSGDARVQRNTSAHHLNELSASVRSTSRSQDADSVRWSARDGQIPAAAAPREDINVMGTKLHKTHPDMVTMMMMPPGGAVPVGRPHSVGDVLGVQRQVQHLLSARHGEDAVDVATARRSLPADWLTIVGPEAAPETSVFNSWLGGVHKTEARRPAKEAGDTGISKLYDNIFFSQETGAEYVGVVHPYKGKKFDVGCSPRNQPAEAPAPVPELGKVSALDVGTNKRKVRLSMEEGLVGLADSCDPTAGKGFGWDGILARQGREMGVDDGGSGMSTRELVREILGRNLLFDDGTCP